MNTLPCLESHRLRAGMVGVGMIFDETYRPLFEQLHAEGLYRRDFGFVDVQLAAVASRTGQRAARYQAALGNFRNCAGTDAMAQLLREPVDVVCVATPDDRHFEAAKLAGLSQIDHLIITHYHGDHFGGAADLVKLIPFKTMYDNADENPSRDRPTPVYLAIQSEKRVMPKPGDEMALQQPSGAALKLKFLAARKKVIDAPPDAKENPFCKDVKGKAKEAVGTVTGRDDLTREGKAQQDKADAQKDAAKKEAEAESARAGAKTAEKRQESEQH